MFQCVNHVDMCSCTLEGGLVHAGHAGAVVLSLGIRGCELLAARGEQTDGS